MPTLLIFNTFVNAFSAYYIPKVRKRGGRQTNHLRLKGGIAVLPLFHLYSFEEFY